MPKKKPGPKEVQIPEEAIKNLDPETQKKLQDIKKKLDSFKEKVIEKFDEYILGVALLPPDKALPPELKEKEKEPDENRVNVLVLVDDAESEKMSKEELKEKLTTIINEIAEKIDKKLSPQTLLLSELWQSCYDGKYDVLQMIAVAAQVYDQGMLSAIKIAEVHKTMVLKKFERYIVSYVLFGSLTRGEATSESDVDVAIIIDDTDVKKMTRAELKDKLRAIIIGMGIEAGNMTGIKNKINIQVYILTDFWESIKEANPVIFTVLRDGIPFYDRGIFMPWKQLLKMGRVKPSQEAIDLYMSSGEKMVEKVKFKLRTLIEADIYWSTLTPAQAAIMLYGLAPPTPKETVQLMDDIFVKKEKMFDAKHLETLRKIRNYYKKLEHGTLKEVSGKDLDDLLERADEYLKALKKLFDDIQEMKEKEGVLHTWDSVVTIIRDTLHLEGVEKVKDVDIIETFESELTEQGKIPEKYLRMLKALVKAKKDYDSGKLTKPEVQKIQKDARELMSFLIEHIQRKRGRELDKAKVLVKHGDKYGEVLLFGNQAFIIHDIDHEEKEISKAKLNEDGSLSAPEPTTLSEFEKALTKIDIPPKTFLKERTFEALKNIFGRDVEILINR